MFHLPAIVLTNDSYQGFEGVRHFSRIRRTSKRQILEQHIEQDRRCLKRRVVASQD